MSLENSEDPFNIDYSDVASSVEQDGRRTVRLPGFCVIILDAQLIDPAYIRHFEDTPLGYLQAMKWAVRMEEADRDSEKTVAQLREEYEKELERSPLEHWEAFEQQLASLQTQADALSAQLSQASGDLETAMGPYDEATHSFRGMNKQERLALCKELGLYVNNKPVSGHNSEQQLYDALIRYKRRDLNLSNLMTQKYNAERALAKANLTLKTAIAQQEIRSEEVEQARAYLAEQGFQPRKVGEEWQVVYPASGRSGTLTDTKLIEKAREVERWHALPAVRRCNPTIGS